MSYSNIIIATTYISTNFEELKIDKLCSLKSPQCKTQGLEFMK